MEKSSSKTKRRRDSSNLTPKRSQHSQSPSEKVDDLAPKPKKSKKDVSATKKSASDPIRLHIAPLTTESAKAIVAVQHLSTASFHTIDTFPEKSYGFVTLPRVEAEALRKKYNGTVFRGIKMSIEEARPVKETSLSPNGGGAGKTREISPLTKGKREDGVLPGFELPEGRQVKRGWAKDVSLKAGKGNNKPLAGTSECLFKTVLPPVIASEIKKTDLEDDKSSKKRSKARAVKNQVVVKEFKNSTKFPSFLKMSRLPTDSAERSAEFVEGVGWVNDAGEVIEVAPAKRTKLNIQKEPTKEEEEEPSSSEGGESQPESHYSVEEVETLLTNSKSLATPNSASGTSESEDDLESDSGSESTDHSTGAPLRKTGSSSGSVDEVSPEASGSSSSESTSNQSSSSESESESESESKAKPTEVQELKPTLAVEQTAKQPSSNFANLTTIFKPKLSLDIETTSQFKFFGGDLDESDGQGEEAEGEAEDDQSSVTRFDDRIPYTPITPQAERYRSGAPTPDTAVAPRFKDFLPSLRGFEISIQRDYFRTITAEKKDTLRKPATGVRLLFPHTYDDSLLAISIWDSVKLPNILTTGELPEKQAPSSEASSAKNIADGEIEMTKSEERTKKPLIAQQPVVALKKTDNFTPDEIDQPKTGSGSKVVGWAGKKKTFGDSDDFDMVDAPALAAPKARMGAGSGVVGWAGKKKTFDDDDNDFDATAPVVDHRTKTKTGSGSGLTAWAGKKKTFDDDSEDLGFSTPVEAPTKAKTGSGSGVASWAGKRKTFDDERGDSQEIEEDMRPVAPKTSTPDRHSNPRSREEEDDREGERAQLPIVQVWEKVFHENRGDWNRQWKRKKREVAKAKRKKEKAKRGWTGVSV
ncbi:hypothetical protein AOL_s00097g572 [Orbilia oligospora ATCC 24927]|uniref:Uncharacterized protein n=1 Tax=Arthrobotrys oligospora (strain ATCC 24927 / CBS 115.81 / DSM 1491) TaxID=756982 RepID=G1XJP5_ARTOA|nr:hypothetical protein AOL_s00097g572 [Orbilia oligospora ATCC 24927]EGX46668.1 hypothetical protein AOL_s00097g572 [Orbilia oligospora ATCC 24927]